MRHRAHQPWPTAAGAVPAEVARITIYVVGYHRDEHLSVIEEARAGLFGDHKPVDSLIGVDRLSPGYLIEVEAIAVTGGLTNAAAQPR